MPEVEDLLTAAAAGEETAWAELVSRYGGLIWAIARGHGLSAADASDVSQTTWLRLVEHLATIRQPGSVGSWIATTARRESLRILRRAGRHVPVPDEDTLLPYLGSSDNEIDEELLKVEEIDELWEAFLQLPDRCQLLLRILMTDPRPSYEEISSAMDMPVGSIGPTRGRCLDRLREILRADGISRAPNDSM
jgi:RNA polymerase sigma factor (sigma-70 family)